MFHPKRLPAPIDFLAGLVIPVVVPVAGGVIALWREDEEYTYRIDAYRFGAILMLTFELSAAIAAIVSSVMF